MIFTCSIALLAACSPLTFAGPVPRHDRRQIFARYANSPSIPSTTVNILTTSLSIVHVQSSLPTGCNLSANAETVLVVQPIQQSVFTSIASAITFQNPDGEDIATESPRTILSTAYITLTSTPATQETASASPSPTATQSLEPKPSESSSLPVSSTVISVVPSSSIAAVENTTTSETSLKIPHFTYSPQEDSTLSSASPTAIPTSETLIPSSAGLPGFNHPGSNARDPTATISLISNSSSIQSTTQPAGPTIVISSVIVPAPTVSSSVSPSRETLSATESGLEHFTSKVYVTTTQYTTVFPSPSLTEVVPSSQASSAPAAPTEVQKTLPAERSSSTIVIPSSSTAVPQQPPPVVIITQYTTVTPTPEPEPTQVPEVSSAPPMSEPVPTSVPVTSTSVAAEPMPSSTAVILEPQPGPSSRAPECPPMPSASESAALPPAITESSVLTTQDAPAPTDAPPTPSSEPIVSSTSEGPLIITPIPASQIFTVTVTATATIRETTTVTVTA